MIAERTKRGEDHILYAPKIPAPLPITVGGHTRRSLIVAPLEIVMAGPQRLRPDVERWLVAFRDSRLNTPVAKASRPDIHAVAGLDEARFDRKLVEATIIAGPRGRAGRRTRTSRERGVLLQEASQAKFELEFAMREKNVGKVQGIEVLEAALMVPSVERPGNATRVIVSVEEYARVAGLLYDETVYLVTESRCGDIVRRWARHPFAYVVVFPDRPPRR